MSNTKISYELAKELKEAGWPQQVRSAIVGNEDSFIQDDNNLDQWLYVPTLEELIEAVRNTGDDGTTFDLRIKSYNLYFASSPMDAFEATEGSTPSEAVARLWLKLKR